MADKQCFCVEEDVIDLDAYGITSTTVISYEEKPPIDMELPEDFQDATDIYTYNIDENRILISANVANIGIWLYTIDNQNFKQIINTYYNFKTFLEMPDGNIICSPTSGMTYVYDITTNTINAGVSESDLRYSIATIDGDALISKYGTSSSLKNSGMYFYNHETKSIGLLLSNVGCNFDTYIETSDNDLLLSGTSSTTANLGIWLYNHTEKTLSKIYDNGYNWTFSSNYYKQLTNGDILLSNLASNGILKYSHETKTINNIFNTGNTYFLSSGFEFDGKLIFSGSYNSIGIYLYKNNTVTQVYSSEVYWNNYFNVDNYILISNSTSTNGILSFDKTTENVLLVYANNSGWKYFYRVTNGALISSTSSNTGILLFNSTSNSCSKIYSSGYEFMNSIELDNSDLLLCSTRTSGIYKYNNNEQTISRVYQNYYYQYIVVSQNGNNIIFGNGINNYTAPILCYTKSTDTFKLLTPQDSKWNSYKIVDDKYILLYGYNSAVYVYNDYNITAKTLISGTRAEANNIMYEENDKFYIQNSNKPIMRYLFDKEKEKALLVDYIL